MEGVITSVSLGAPFRLQRPFYEGFNNPFVDGVNRKISVDAMYVRVRHLIKYRAGVSQACPVLKMIRLFAAVVGNPMNAHHWIDIKEVNGIRPREESVHFFSHNRHICSTRPLISDRRIKVPIEDHDRPRRQVRSDQSFDVFRPILDERL